MNRGYEKIIVACCFLCYFVNIGFPSTSFSVYQPYLVALPYVGDTGGSVLLAVRTVVSFAVLFGVDRFYGALDVRVGLLVSCLLTAAGFAVYGLAGSLGALCAGAVLAGAGYGLGGAAVVTVLTDRWFEGGVGTALGIASMGSGVATIVVPLMVTAVVARASLAAAFLAQAAAAAVLGLVVFALVRNRPSDLGLEPYRGAPGRMRAARRASALRPAPRAAKASFLAGVVLVGALCVGGFTYLAVMGTTSGITFGQAGLVVSVGGVALTLAKLVIGRLFDSLGSARATAILFGAAVAGLALYCLLPLGGFPLALVAVVLLGFGLSMGTAGVPVWSIDLSAPGERARFVKHCQIAYQLGSFAALVLPGPLKDLTGSYAVSYAGFTACALVAGLLVLRHYRRYVTWDDGDDGAAEAL